MSKTDSIFMVGMTITLGMALFIIIHGKFWWHFGLWTMCLILLIGLWSMMRGAKHEDNTT